MTPMLTSALIPVLRRLEAERAHRLAIMALRLGLAGRDRTPHDPALAIRAMGLDFSNPIGLSAGFDKNGVALRGLRRLGFGLIEVGTVTPRPQAGNPAPRVFRLAADGAVINRYGMNNLGLDAFVRRLAAVPRGSVPIGANVGINKDGAEPERDYPALIRAVAPYADYVVINVSSPNTPGLRDLQGEGRLRAILAAIATSVPTRPPLLVKIAPDLADTDIDAVADLALELGLDGIIATNTTVSRANLATPNVEAIGPGGLSGAPLKQRSLEVLRRIRARTGSRLVLISVGGIETGEDAWSRIRAGATLVQAYTGFIYGGPTWPRRVQRELAALARAAGFESIEQAIGTDPTATFRAERSSRP